jgi:hypothetical protein
VNRDAAREQRRAIAAAGPHWRLGAYSTLALASLALAASVMGLYLVLVQLDQADQRETVHRIDLSHELPPVLDSVRFAHLGALQVHEARYEYKRRRPDEFHRITPLVPSGWRPEQPVRLIYDEQNRGSSSQRRLSDEPVALTRNDLPAFVESALRRQGLQLASPYYVARPVDIRHGRVVSWMADFHWMPMAAAIAGAALFVVGAGVVWLRRRLRRSIKAAPARPRPQPSQPETV